MFIVKMIFNTLRVLIVLGLIQLFLPDLSFSISFLVGDFLGNSLFGGN